MRNASKLEGNFVARANGFARVMNHEGLRRGQMKLRGQMALRRSSTRVLNHEGNFVARVNGFARVMNHEGLRRGSSTFTNINYFAFFCTSSFFLIAVVIAYRAELIPFISLCNSEYSSSEMYSVSLSKVSHE